MQLLLTDRLTCPRCGPSFGLILLADRLVDRRVHDGVLGCPNCRDRFTIADGFADLRAPPRGALPPGRLGAGSWTTASVGADSAETSAEGLGDDGGSPAEGAQRLTALLGILRGPGTVALAGDPARHAAALAHAVTDLQVVAIDAELHAWPDAEGVSRMVAGPGLPFFSRTLRGVAVDGRLGRSWVEEAVRVVAPMARVVVTHAPEWTAAVLADGSLSVLAAEAETVVAARG